MTQSEIIVGRFGGISALAHAIERTPSTVQRWCISGNIPHEHWNAILEAGQALSPPLRREEFVQHLPMGAREAEEFSLHQQLDRIEQTLLGLRDKSDEDGS